MKSEELTTLCCIERGQQFERLASYVAAKIVRCNLTRAMPKVLELTFLTISTSQFTALKMFTVAGSRFVCLNLILNHFNYLHP